MSIARNRRVATGFLQDFREFALKGNVVELAIAVIIGGAFGKIVTSFTEDLVMPLINPLLASVGGDWRTLTIPPGAENGLKVGNFLGAILDFVVIAFALFLAIQALAKFKRKEELAPPAPTEQECPYCFEKLPLAATRCRACTSDLINSRV